MSVISEPKSLRATRKACENLLFAGVLIGALAGGQRCFAQGTMEAISNYSSSGTEGEVAGTAGWAFEATTPITITAVGAFTNALANQGGGPLAVGVWNSAGSLLASNLITVASSLAGLSRYESITPIFLEPGQTYYVGAYSPNGITVLDVYDGTPPPLIVASQIQITGLAAASGGFVAPTLQPGTEGDAYLGGNFQFQQGIPEPGTPGLLALAFALAASWKRLSRS